MKKVNTPSKLKEYIDTHPGTDVDDLVALSGLPKKTVLRIVNDKFNPDNHNIIPSDVETLLMSPKKLAEKYKVSYSTARQFQCKTRKQIGLVASYKITDDDKLFISSLIDASPEEAVATAQEYNPMLKRHAILSHYRQLRRKEKPPETVVQDDILTLIKEMQTI